MKKSIIILIICINIMFGNEQKEDFYKMGIDYLYGINGKDKDINFANIWLKESAKKGNTKANLLLGILYYNGEEITKDFNLSKEYFLKSFEESESKYYLSLMYENGNGVSKDIEKSNQLLQASIEKRDYQPAILKYALKEKKAKNYRNAESLLKELIEKGNEQSKKEYDELCIKNINCNSK